MNRLLSSLTCLILLVLNLGFGISARAQTDSIVYDDALQNNWGNWGWASSIDIASTAYVHTGSNSIAVTAFAWEGFQLGHNWPAPFDTTGYGNLTFWINGGPVGGQALQVYGTLNYSGQPPVSIGSIEANTWKKITIPLAALGIDNSAALTTLVIQNTGTDAPTFYVDDIVITGSVPVVPPPPLNGGMALYDDAYVNGWDNWSWATINTANTNPVNSGASSIAVNAGPYQALRFHHNALDTQGYSALTFWINGGAAGGQMLSLNALLADVAQPGYSVGPLPANTWQKVTVPLSALGAANKPNLTDFWFQENNGLTLPTFYVDDVRLELAPPPDVVQVRVDASRRSGTVDARMFGLNTAIWDGAFNTANTAELLSELDNQALRFPGGSISDIYHWKTNTSHGETWQWATSFEAFANIATVTQAQAYITVNYGTGTPEEAAEWVTYANKTKRYRFKYWEVGNENYGTWEADNNNRPHDPVTYATRFKEYVRLMKKADATISIGAVIQASEDSDANYNDQTVINPRTGQPHDGWTAVLLTTFRKLGVTPDFVVYHRYEQGPGGENDAYLLNSSKGWAADSARIRQILIDYLGETKGRKVEISCTENNSVYGNPGKQTTSLVNGLFYADSLGNILQTEFQSFFWWDLRNGQEAGNNNSSSLYGWRKYGDYGIVNAANPAGPADRYPTFYVYKLLQHFARGNERVIGASSDYNGLGAYAVRDLRGETLNLLLINKHPVSELNAVVTVDRFKFGQQVEVFSYGIPQDEAARTGSGSADISQTTITLTGPTFTYKPAPYSATVIRLKQAEGESGE